MADAGKLSLAAKSSSRVGGKTTNQTADYEDEFSSSDQNYPNGFKLIKEETIEEILDLEPELKRLADERISGRGPKQIIRIDKPREDGRTRITVSANQLRDKMLLLGQHNKSSLADSQSRVVRVPQRIIIAEGGIMPANVGPTNRKPSQSVLVQQNSSSVAPLKSPYTVPATHRQLAKPDPMCPKRGHTTMEHPSECDKYYFCEEGMMSEQTCPNGLVYGIHNTVIDYCIYRWEATCGDKTIPNPISSPGCRWQYGLSTVQGSPKCSKNYYECKAGKYEIKQCPLESQVYDDLSKSCREGKTVGCAINALADFHCPHDDQSNHYWPFPRYFLDDKTLIHCINDKPELVKCNSDERVDPERLHCVPATDRVKVEEKIPQILQQQQDRVLEN